MALTVQIDFQLDRIAAGDHTCTRGLNPPYQLSCWGPNDSGQIGDGTSSTMPDYTPSAAIGGSWERIAVGFAFTCGLDHPSGYVWCWGLNDHGQLGDGTTTNRDAPGQLSTGDVFTDITAGYEHVCAIDSNQATWCWGYNGNGQLGANDAVDHSSPVQVAGGMNWKRIAAGRLHTCGITDAPDDGELWCWGDNRRGQLGNGDPTRASVAMPTRIGTDTDWQELATGDWHTCAIRAGNVYCWGENDDGQLADGTGWNPDAQLVPIP
jgi:alpha-tubulin suppressor-like RCC1 family protein